MQIPELSDLPIEGKIRRIAHMYGVNQELALRISQCENGSHQLDRKNYDWPNTTASGLYQFTNPTWVQTRRQMGEPDDNLTLKHTDIEHIRTAMWKIANGGLSAWDASKQCWSA